jgi:hypothetical protein
MMFIGAVRSDDVTTSERKMHGGADGIRSREMPCKRAVIFFVLQVTGVDVVWIRCTCGIIVNQREGVVLQVLDEQRALLSRILTNRCR